MSLKAGIGIQAEALKDPIGSHPAKQLTPLPHTPYSEQQGELSGQRLSHPQVVVLLSALAEVVAVGVSVARGVVGDPLAYDVTRAVE